MAELLGVLRDADQWLQPVSAVEAGRLQEAVAAAGPVAEELARQLHNRNTPGCSGWPSCAHRLQVSRGLKLQSTWRIPTAAAS